MPDKPSDFEEEYIRAEEIEKLRRQRLADARQTAEDERERLKKLHWMHCPKCGTALDEIESYGVTVDFCFGCEGLFLDKGELDAALARATDEGRKGPLARLVTDLFRTKKY
jgi:hypothetical protein